MRSSGTKLSSDVEEARSADEPPAPPVREARRRTLQRAHARISGRAALPRVVPAASDIEAPPPTAAGAAASTAPAAAPSAEEPHHAARRLEMGLSRRSVRGAGRLLYVQCATASNGGGAVCCRAVAAAANHRAALVAVGRRGTVARLTATRCAAAR